MNKILSAFLTIIILGFITNNNLAQVKLAQTGLKFLSVSADAKASAIGGAVTALEGNSSSMFYNPAGMARQSSFMDATFSMTQWIADIDYLHASMGFAPSDGAYGVFGISVASVDYGKFNRTIRDGGGEAGYIDLGTYSPKAMSIGLGYAKSLSDKFSVGGNVKYVYQDLGGGHIVALNTTTGGYDKKSFDVNVFAFDFGILYKLGFESLNFGMSLRNFSQEIEYVEESFQLPLSFKIGLSMNMFDLFEVDKNEQAFIMSVDAEHPRDYKEQVNIGGEYIFWGAPDAALTSFSIRLGYVTPTDEQGISAGIGLNHDLGGGTNLGVDYAYLSFGVFEGVHRFSINISY